MMKFRSIMPTVALALACAASYGQNAGLRDSLQQASRAIDKSDFAHAKAIYKSIEDRNDTSFAAKMGLSRVAIAEGEWSDATSYLDDAIELDTSSIAAHYYGGIAYRELGTFRAWLVKNSLWNTARDHFLWVMSRDSSYSDVLLQFAVLELYRKNYDHAFSLAARQSDLRPDRESVHFGLFNLYRMYLGSNDPEDVLLTLRLQHSDWARYFVGVALRRLGRFDEAEEAFSDLYKHPGIIPPEAVTLALSRLYYARGDDARGEALYWRSVDHIDTWLGAAMIFEDLKYIINDAELKYYEGLFSDRKKSRFFHAFWNRRNPSAASRTNSRLAEHYHRLDYAEKNYEFYGTRSHFNDPDKMHYLTFPKSFSLNHEFNDEGLIYLRLGAPDEQQRTSSGMSQSSSKEFDQHESWLYKGGQGQRQQIFHFAKSNSVSNSWRLTSLPEDPSMLENLVMWDSRYYSLLDEKAPDRARMTDELRTDEEGTVSEALATDKHSWSKETKLFDVPHAIETFRREPGKTMISIVHALPIEEIEKEMNTGDGPVRVEVGLSVMRWNGEMVGAQIDTMTFARGGEGSVIELFRYSMKPESISVAMHFRPLGSDLYATWRKDIRVPNYDIPEPVMSDIQFLLPSATKSNYDFNGVKVVVSPYAAVPRSKPFMLYWELYNLTKDADGNTRVTTQVLITEGDSQPNEDSKVLYDETVDGHDETAPEFVQLNISDLSKGLHTITVRVTDRKRVYTMQKSRLVQILSD